MASAFLDRVSNKALGELLVEKGALSEAQVSEALEFSRAEGVRLGEALVSLGYINRDALGYAIGEQYGLTPMELQPSMVDRELVGRFDFELLSAHTMLPLIELGHDLVVVVSDPNNQEGLTELARLLPEATITPQLGTAVQIRRCLEAVRPQGGGGKSVHGQDAHATVHGLDACATGNLHGLEARATDKTLPFFKVVPEAGSAEFIEWLVGLAASHADRDVLVRDLEGGFQVCLTPSTATASGAADAPDVGLEEIGRWPGIFAGGVRDRMLQRGVPLEHMRGQAARWAYTMKHGGRRFNFLILTPIAHDGPMVLIRALTHLDVGAGGDGDSAADDFSPVPLSLELEAGKYTVVLYDPSVSLERALALFMEENSADHSFVVGQYATRCVFSHGLAYPAPFVNMVTAAQAVAATCVIYDHPVEYREAVRLLTSTYPPPAVLVCAPLPSSEGGAGVLSPDVEELISRQGAQSVRLHMNANTGAGENLNAAKGDE